MNNQKLFKQGEIYKKILKSNSVISQTQEWKNFEVTVEKVYIICTNIYKHR